MPLKVIYIFAWLWCKLNDDTRFGKDFYSIHQPPLNDLPLHPLNILTIKYFKSNYLNSMYQFIILRYLVFVSHLTIDLVILCKLRGQNEI